MNILYNLEFSLDDLRDSSIYPTLIDIKAEVSEKEDSWAYEGERIGSFLNKLKSAKNSPAYEELIRGLSALDQDRCIYYGFGLPPWKEFKYLRSRGVCSKPYFGRFNHPLSQALIRLQRILDKVGESE